MTQTHTLIQIIYHYQHDYCLFYFSVKDMYVG